MANVIFKRGLQNDLKSTTKQDGVFYLTTDTGRLYVDVDQGGAEGIKRHLLNQTVQFVETISALETLANSWNTEALQNAHINDLFYVTGSNILAVYTKTGPNNGWQQINPDHDTKIVSAAFGKTASANTSTITLTLTDNAATGANSITATFVVETAGGLTLSNNTSTGALVFTAPTYSLDRSIEAGSNDHTAILKLDSSDNTLDSQLRLAAGNNVTFDATTSGTLGISVHNTTLGNNSVEFTGGEGSLTVGVSDSDGNGNSVTLSNLGIVLNNNSYVPLTSTAGKTAGGIYSKAEIDNMLNGLDGMRYMGTVSSSAGLPTTGVHVGDMYVITANNLSTTTDFAGVSFNTSTLVNNDFPGGSRVGDMLIASGTETVVNDQSIITSDLQWTYIPSGNDTLDAVSYQTDNDASTNTFKLENIGHTMLGQLTLNAGTDIVLSSITADGGKTLSTTVSHATITTTSTTAATLSTRAETFTAIKSITATNGHITNIELDTFTPVKYDLVDASTTALSAFAANTNTGTATMEITIGLEDDNSTARHSSKLNLTSSNIKLTGVTGGVAMNFEWGTF